MSSNSNLLGWLRSKPENKKELEKRGLSSREVEIESQLQRARSERREAVRVFVGLDEPPSPASNGVVDLPSSDDSDSSWSPPVLDSSDLGRYTTGTWADKAFAIFFFLHDELGDGDYELSARLFGWKVRTFEGWLTKEDFHVKWMSFASKLTVGDVLDRLKPGVAAQYASVDRKGTLSIDDIGYTLTSKTKKGDLVFTYNGKRKTGQPDNRGHSKKHKKHGYGKVYLRKSAKNLGSGGRHKHREQMVRLNEIITQRWETGNPIGRAELTATLIKEYSEDKESDFYKRLIDPDNSKSSNNLVTWISRMLKYWSWSERKKSISQTVPKNWYDLCVEETELIRKFILEIQPDVVINADEVFFQFYPEDDKVLAQTGAKRIGSNRNPSNEKLGCTVMMGMEMFSSRMAPPFIIFNGAPLSNPRAILGKQWLDYDGYATVRFQAKHWMDTEAAIEYLKMLKSHYPDQKIVILWDHAGAHISDDTIAWMESNGVNYMAIAKCLTSIIQPCDVYCNKPVKQRVKVSYGEWKLTQDVPVGGKYKVPRKLLVKWIEDAVSEFDKSVRMSRGIFKSFQICGIDLEDAELSKFMSHLNKLSNETVYGTLLDNQRASDLV